MDIQERFWSKVDIRGEDDCWEWKAYKCTHGYGRFNFNGKIRNSNRIAMIFSGTKIPRGMNVNHHCDNPSCCNPNHLYVGTQKDNMRDRVERGHSTTPPCYGEKNENSKLTQLQVDFIYKWYIPYKIPMKLFADWFGVRSSSICNIVNNKTWKTDEYL